MKEMYYYKQNGENLEKWLISFDAEKLAKLREEVLVKCSYITHEEKVLTEKEMEEFTKSGLMRNIEEIGKSYTNYDTMNHKEYVYQRYSYDIYKPKILVSIIDALLKGEPSAIDELDNPRPTEAKWDFEKEVAKESAKVDNIPNLETKRKIEALQNLHELAQEAKLNENQVSALDYYPLVQALLKKELVDIIKIEDILRTTSFFAKYVDIFGLCLNNEDKNNLKLYLKPNV